MFPSQLKITALIFIFHILCVCYLCFSIVSLQFDFLHWNDCSTECWLVGLLLWKLMDSFHVVSTCINIMKLMALLYQCLMWIELNWIAMTKKLAVDTLSWRMTLVYFYKMRIYVSLLSSGIYSLWDPCYTSHPCVSFIDQNRSKIEITGFFG